jgi:hypothetical protein
MLMAAFVGACEPPEDSAVEEDLGQHVDAACQLGAECCPISVCSDAATNGIDDVANTFGGATTISIGGTFTDEINSNTDQDYFKFYQYSGIVTRVSVTGANCWLHYKVGTSSYPPSGYVDSNASSSVCFIQFVPTVSRWWYIKVQRTDGLWGDAATTGASKPCGPQPHSLLTQGVPLDDGGDPDECCVPVVCRWDSYCCNNWWDATCVEEAQDWCGI